MSKNHISQSPRDQEGWRKSSYSNSSSGACVEVKYSTTTILVRDSKDHRHQRPVITLHQGGWKSFMETVAR